MLFPLHSQALMRVSHACRWAIPDSDDDEDEDPTGADAAGPSKRAVDLMSDSDADVDNVADSEDEDASSDGHLSHASDDEELDGDEDEMHDERDPSSALLLAACAHAELWP